MRCDNLCQQIGDDVIFHSCHLGITIFKFEINRNAVAEWVRSDNNGLCDGKYWNGLLGLSKLSYAHEKDFCRS